MTDEEEIAAAISAAMASVERRGVGAFVGGYRLGITIAIHLVRAYATRERELDGQFKDPAHNDRHATRAQALVELEDTLRKWERRDWEGIT